MTKIELKTCLETILRCSIEKVAVPDSDIYFAVDNLALWIEKRLMISFEG